MPERVELTVPENFDNCLKYCPRHVSSAILKHCIQEQCPGPVVREELVDVSAYGTDQDTSYDLDITCGTVATHVGDEQHSLLDGSPVIASIARDQTALREGYTTIKIRR